MIVIVMIVNDLLNKYKLYRIYYYPMSGCPVDALTAAPET